MRRNIFGITTDTLATSVESLNLDLHAPTVLDRPTEKPEATTEAIQASGPGCERLPAIHWRYDKLTQTASIIVVNRLTTANEWAIVAAITGGVLPVSTIHLYLGGYAIDATTGIRLASYLAGQKERLIVHIGILRGLGVLPLLSIAGEVKLSQFSAIILDAEYHSAGSGAYTDIEDWKQLASVVDHQIRTIAVDSALLSLDEIESIQERNKVLLFDHAAIEARLAVRTELDWGIV